MMLLILGKMDQNLCTLDHSLLLVATILDIPLANKSTLF